MVNTSAISVYLKSIEECKLTDIDINELKKVFKENPNELGDVLQYHLFQFCKKDLEKEDDADVVIKLAKLCYSKKSVAGFSHIGRFLGCLCYIIKYLLKREKYEAALELCKALDERKDDIIRRITGSGDASVPYNLFTQFIITAQKLAASSNSQTDDSVELSHSFFEASIGFLSLIQIEQTEYAKSIIAYVNHYFSCLKFYDTSLRNSLYRKFINHLETLDRNFEEHHFLCYYIFKLELLKDEKDLQVCKDLLRQRIHLLLILLKNEKLTKLWDLILDFFIRNLNTSCSVEVVIKAAEEIYKKGNRLNLIVLSIVFKIGVQIWCKENLEDWSKVVSVGFIQKLFDGILLPLRNRLGDLSNYCISGITLKICFADSVISNVHKILYAIRLCLKTNVQDNLMLIDVLRRGFMLGNECLCEMMKNECCLSSRKDSWSQSVIHYTNATEDLVRLSINTNCFDYLRNCAKDIICELFNSEYEVPFGWNRVSLLFQRWHYANLRLQDFKESLFVSAFYLVSCPSDEEAALSLWLQTKSQMIEDSDKDVTIIDVITKKENIEKIKKLNPKFENNLDVKSLSMKELKAYDSYCYSSFRKSSILGKSITQIWIKLRNEKLDLYEKAYVLDCVMKRINVADLKLANLHKDECEKVIDELMKFTPENKSRNLFYAGNLKYLLFIANLKTIQNSEGNLNSAKAVLTYLKKEEEEKVKFGEEMDQNLTCNIMPSSSNLNIELEERYLSVLNETLKLWSKSCRALNEASLSDQEFEIWLNNLKQLAFMYELIGDYYKCMNSWILHYKISCVSNDKSSQLISINQLIKDCKNMENSPLFLRGEALAEETSKLEKKNMAAKYWLTIASNHLKNKNDAKCYEYLKKAEDVIKSIKDGKDVFILQAKYWSMIFGFVCVYPDYMKDFNLDPDWDIRYVIYKAFQYINSGIKNEITSTATETEYSELMLEYIQVSMIAVHVFGLYCLNTYVRMFLDNLYQLVQKLMLPTRTAEMLVRLAQVDVMCENLDALSVKLNELKTILKMDTWNFVEEDEIPQLKIPEPDFSSPRPVSPARFLDASNRYREADGSPYISTERNGACENAKHSKNCKCSLCRNILIRLLIAETCGIEGQYCLKKGSIKKAHLCFSRSNSYFKKLEMIRLEENRRLQNEIEDLTNCLDFKRNLVQFHSARFLIDYAKFQLTPEFTGEKNFGSLVKRIEKLIGNLNYEQRLLEWNFMELKIGMCIIMNNGVTLATTEAVKSPALFTLSQTLSVPSASVVKTPTVVRPLKKTFAPAKYKSVPEKSPNEMMTRPSGRKILIEEDEEEVQEEELKVIPNPKKFFKTPKAQRSTEIPKTQPENFFSKDGRTTVKKRNVTPKSKKLTPKKKPTVIFSDEDDKPNQEVVQTSTRRPKKQTGRRLNMNSEAEDPPEPERRALRPNRSKKPEKEAEAEETENNISCDLFESFEAKLKIMEEKPVPEKTGCLKKKSVKK